MDNPGVYTLAAIDVLGPRSGRAQTPIVDLDGMTTVMLEALFQYGSGGTSCNAIVQTSLDGGTSWVDIARFDFTTTPALKGASVSGVPPVDVETIAALTIEGTNNGVLGDRLRVVDSSVGTYADTSLTIRASAGDGDSVPFTVATQDQAEGFGLPDDELDNIAGMTPQRTAQAINARGSNEVNARIWALGDDEANDSAALQAAITSCQENGATLVIPKGYQFRVKALRALVAAPLSIRLDGNLAPYDLADLTSANWILFAYKCTDLAVRGGGTFAGVAYPSPGVQSVGYGLPGAPYYHLLLSENSPDYLPKCRISGPRFIGGQFAMTATYIEDIVIEDTYLYGQYQWGMSFAPLNARLVRNRIYGVGLGEGIKFGANARANDGGEVDVSWNQIARCGRIDPNPANWQEGIDSFQHSMQHVTVISNRLTDNGNGGLEIKLNDNAGNPLAPPDIRLEQYVVAHNIIDHDTGGNGISVHWQGSTEPGDDLLMGRMLIDGNICRCRNMDADPQKSLGIYVAQSRDVVVSRNFVQGYAAGYAVRQDFDDGVVDRLALNGNIARDCRIGASIVSALDVTHLKMNGNDLEGIQVGLSIAMTGGGAVSGYIKGGSITQTADDVTGGGNAIRLSGIDGLLIDDVDLESYSYAVYAPTGGSNGVGRIIHNRMKSRQGVELVKLDAGADWQVGDNTALDLPTTKPFITGAGSWAAWDNARGYAAEAPSYNASVGDIVHANPPSATTSYWEAITTGTGGWFARPGTAGGGGGFVLLPQTSALNTAMTVKPDFVRVVLMNTLYDTLLSAGILNKIDVLYLIGAHDSQAAQLNWINPATFQLSPIGSPTYVTDRAYTLNGSTQYLDTGWKPGVNGVKTQLTDASVGIWSLDNVSSTTQVDWSVSSGGYQQIISRTGGNGIGAALHTSSNSSTIVGAPAITNGIGHTAVSRSGDDVSVYKDGSLVAAYTAADSHAVGLSAFIGAHHTSGVATLFSTRRIFAAHAGGALTAAEMLTLRSALATFRQGIGAV